MGNIVAEPTVSVDYEELEGSPKESYGSKGFQATRHLMCSWADRHTLARQLKGGRPELRSWALRCGRVP